ncbi:MAG: thioredoxin family protein [Muribaculaceae bacterium]
MKKILCVIIICCIASINSYSKAEIRLINYEELNDNIFPNMERPALIFFGRNNCPYVKKMVPIVNKLATNYENSVDFYNVNGTSSANYEWLEELDIQGLPWIVIYYGPNRKAYSYFGGPNSYNDLAEALTEAITEWDKQ